MAGTSERDAALDLGDTSYGGVQPMCFTKVNEYTSFHAEYSFDGDDLVFHFFISPEHKGDRRYWLETFPLVLDPTARKYFKAEMPRLRAAYTEEMDSWWLRADGYDQILDKHNYCKRFLAKLDQDIDTVISK